MTKFTNKSWSFTAGVIMLWLSVLVITLFIAWVTFESVFMARIFQNLDQNSLVLVLVEFILLLAGIYLLILIPIKNIIFKAFLVLDDKGIQLQYMDLKFQLQNEKWKWKDVTDISETIGNTEYEFSINTKNTRIKLPLEIYQNTIRVNKIKKALGKYTLTTNYAKTAQIVLLVTDVIIGFVLVFVILFLLFFILKQFS